MPQSILFRLNARYYSFPKGYKENVCRLRNATVQNEKKAEQKEK